MKKYNIFLLGALGVLATSCAEDITPAPPQQNPQEPIVASDDVVSQKDGVLSAATPTVTLEDYRADGSMIPVMKLVSTENLPEGAAISYNFDLSASSDFDREVTLTTTPGEANEDGSVVYYVDAQQWNDAHLYLFGKSPKVKTAYYRIPVYVNLDGSNYRLNSTDYYAAEGTIEETCMDSGFVIEDHYYFLSDATTWSFAEAASAEFAHSADVSVYDDPVFTFTFKATGTTYWKIAPQSAIDADSWDNVLGTETDGDSSLSGMLVNVNAQAGKLDEAGTYKLTINMETMSYSFERLLQPEVLYTPGVVNGWAFDTCALMQLKSATADEAGYYYGVFPVTSDEWNPACFKITTEPNWNNENSYGAASADPSSTGTLVNAGGSNISAPEAGLYWVRADFDPVSYMLTTYTFVPIEYVSLIGGFAESEGWSKDVDMVSNDNGATWTADITLKEGDEYKVRFNHGWDYSLGENAKDLIVSNNNIISDVDGEYTVTLKLQPGVPSLTLTKKN